MLDEQLHELGDRPVEICQHALLLGVLRTRWVERLPQLRHLLPLRMRIERFADGNLIDEAAAAAVAH